MVLESRLKVIRAMKHSCNKCKSKNIYVKQANTRTGLYCADCGAWIQWLTYRETMRAYEYMKNNDMLPDDVAYKRCGRFGNSTIVKCSNCGCQLFHSTAPKPIGQFDLIDADFCPSCGRKFVYNNAEKDGVGDG